MLYRDLVLKSYQEAVQLHPTANSDLKRALKSHERVPLFINNLCKEIEKAQEYRLRTKKKKYLESTIKSLVYDMTNVFISGIEMEAKQRYESDMQKMIREQEARAKQDLESSASGKLTGEYADLANEAGLTMTDERSDV